MIAIELYRARIGCFRVLRKKGKSTEKVCCPNVFKMELSLFYMLQTCIIFMYLITLKFNTNMSFLKLAMLLIDGNIESNPGPNIHPFKNRVRFFSPGTHKVWRFCWDSMLMQRSICYRICPCISRP